MQYSISSGRIYKCSLHFADEVGEVLRELCKIHEFSMASSLQKEYGELVDYAGRCVASIWTTTPSSDRVKYGPQATAADIISQESAASSAGYTPPWHLLGTFDNQICVIYY